MQTFTGFINYGCLAAEKRQVWTAITAHGTATCSDAVEITAPDGWELIGDEYGAQAVKAPWGNVYRLNDVLTGNEDPRFTAYDNDDNKHIVKLEWRKI